MQVSEYDFQLDGMFPTRYELYQYFLYIHDRKVLFEINNVTFEQ